jgi:hypothetical protein
MRHGHIGGGLPAVFSLMAALPAAAADPGRALEYVPRAIGETRDGDVGLGWLLIVVAIVLAIVIVGFVIRHHQSGRAG